MQTPSDNRRYFIKERNRPIVLLNHNDNVTSEEATLPWRLTEQKSNQNKSVHMCQGPEGKPLAKKEQLIDVSVI